ncbi:MAG: AsmA-like C-terminal region-containing protein, partial [Longimicrobiales bacterium]|nr:AsmA-like C-terminal region-containing protein [Longimicrobiales bacterium]
MRRSTKVLLAGGAGLATLLLAILLVPLLFSEQIEARVRAEIEKASGFRVSWSGARLGLLGDFPHPSLRLTDLQVLGTGLFEADTLARLEEAAISLNGPALIATLRGGGPLVVRTVRLDAPRVRLRVTEHGVASWRPHQDPSDPEPEAATEDDAGSGVAVSLQAFRITDGDIELDDARTRSYLAMRGLDHELRGDFSRASLEAETRTRAEGLTVTLAGTPYLSGVGLEYEGAVRVDTERPAVELTDQQLNLNDLALAFGGSLERDGEVLAVELSFGAPSTDFGTLLSLASTLYDNDFSELQTSGTFSLQGEVRGRYGPDDFPAFSLALSVSDGRFRYPDLPLPAEEISAELAVANPGGALDSTVVDLSRFHVRIGSETFDASARVATPVSDPAVNLRVDGTLDLASVARTVKLPRAEGLSGVVVADATIRARRSDVDSARYDRVDARGTVSATNVALRGEAFRQPVDIRALELNLTPSAAELTTLDAQAGSSDVRASGRLDNLLGFALGGGTLAGSGRFQSRRVVLDEWRSGRALNAIPVPPRLDLTLEGTIQALEVSGLELADARGRAIVRDQRLTFDGFRLQGLGGRIALDGYYETLDAQRPTFNVTLGLDSLDIQRTSSALASFRTLAPVARYARGTFSTDLALSGAMGQDLSPDLTVLDGNGSFSTSPVAVEGFPLLQRLSERLEFPRLSNPTLDAVRSSIRIEDG